MEQIPEIIELSYDYTTEALGLQQTIRERMELLGYKDFERVLHPAFEEDEIILIVIGALLGCAASSFFILTSIPT
eukprot:CAMPEP_0194318598 /NCGR_PEP_ID=MMETSP0171-20130528/15188_1 /TAXON_ID=218684 /ORGANISM="Corethron pennatum, Strain L29A3" /LENGTH=74 /DNA_ID=CAMNT_0039075557 /DNA_START=1027 /DNA_END=1251 /DNA_ORIENTATION=+